MVDNDKKKNNEPYGSAGLSKPEMIGPGQPPPPPPSQSVPSQPSPSPPPPPATPSGSVGISRDEPKITTPKNEVHTEKGGTVSLGKSQYTKSEFETVLGRKIFEERTGISQLESQYKSIDPGKMYYKDRDRKTIVSGSIIREDIKRQIFERKKYKGELEAYKSEFEKAPSHTIIKQTKTGYETVIPDLGKQWVSKQYEKIETFEKGTPIIGPVFGTIAKPVFGGAITVASWAKATPATLPYTGPRVYGLGGQISAPVFSPRKTAEAQVKLQQFDFPTAMDIVYEPVGLSPKGSSEFVTSRPSYLIGSIGTEVLSGYVFGKTIVPSVSKYISGKYSKFVTRLKPERQYELSGRIAKVGYPYGKPSISSRLSVMWQKTGSRIGLGKHLGVGKTTTYKSPLVGVPKLTESGKLVYGTQKVWMHTGGPSYQKMVKGSTSIGGKLIYDPSTQQVSMMFGRTTIGKPGGVLFRKGMISRKFDLLQYGYADKIYTVKKDINVFGRGIWQTESATASLTRQIPRVSYNIPSTMFKTPSYTLIPVRGMTGIGQFGMGLVGTLGWKGIQFGVEKKKDYYFPPVQKTKPAYGIKPGVGIVNIQTGILGIQPIQDFGFKVLQTQASKQEFKPVYVQKKTVLQQNYVPKELKYVSVKPSLGLILPRGSLYGRGRKYGTGLGLKRKYRFREYISPTFKHISPFKGKVGLF